MEAFDQDLEILKLAADCEKEIMNDLHSLDDSIKYKVIEELKLKNYCSGLISEEVSKLEKLISSSKEQKLLCEKTEEQNKACNEKLSSFESELSGLSVFDNFNVLLLYLVKQGCTFKLKIYLLKTVIKIILLEKIHN